MVVDVLLVPSSDVFCMGWSQT